MNTPINIGVVGLGRLGRLYARYFTNRLPGARLYGVTDIHPEAVRATVAETGAIAQIDEEAAMPATALVIDRRKVDGRGGEALRHGSRPAIARGTAGAR